MTPDDRLDRAETALDCLLAAVLLPFVLAILLVLVVCGITVAAWRIAKHAGRLVR